MDFEFFDNDFDDEAAAEGARAVATTKNATTASQSTGDTSATADSDKDKLSFKRVIAAETASANGDDSWATQYQTQTQDFDEDDVATAPKPAAQSTTVKVITDFQTQEEENNFEDTNNSVLSSKTATSTTTTKSSTTNNANYTIEGDEFNAATEENIERSEEEEEEEETEGAEDYHYNNDKEEEEEKSTTTIPPPVDSDDDEEERVDFRKLPEHACRYCGVQDPECVVRCVDCKRWFCNGRGSSSAAHIIQHLVKARHREIATHPNGTVGDGPIECYNCGGRNLFNLGYVPAKTSKAIVILCREPCAAAADQKDQDQDWDVSLWRPLIEERCLVEWLARPPTEAEEQRALPVTISQIALLEDAWHSGHPRAFLRDLNGACIAVDNNDDDSNSNSTSGGSGGKKGGRKKGGINGGGGDDDYDDDDDEERSLFRGRPAPVTLRYSGAEEYVAVFQQLVRMEEAVDKTIKEAQKYDGVNVRWSAVPTTRGGASASFVYPKYETELHIVPGDELVLRHGKYNAQGQVVRIQNEEVVVEFRPGRKFDLQLRDFTQGFSVEFIWKGGSFDRMRTALRAFARDETSVSSELYRRLLGLEVPQDNNNNNNNDDNDNDNNDDDDNISNNDPSAISRSSGSCRNFRSSHQTMKAPGLPALNQSQSYAVEAVLSRPLTLIQGPPGTGKTVTSATIVYNLVQRGNNGSNGSNSSSSSKITSSVSCDSISSSNSNSSKSGTGRVLVCAPSNVAVDHLTAKIHAAGLKVVRLVAKSRETLSSPVDFLALHNQVRALDDPEITTLLARKESQDWLTNAEEERLRTLWRRRELRLLEMADVVCCTCTGAGDPRLRSLKFERVLIDESTQATEPECLIPIVRGARQLVLVGDHCQLGPVVMCKPAAIAGLTQSLFERLVLLGVRPVRLQVQYRMHPALSEFPSNTFYEGTLQNGLTVADRTPPPSRGSSAVTFPWPQPSHPLIFYNCPGGREEISSSGTSFINRAEAHLCEKIVTQFLKAGTTPAQIGIITPYEGQRAYIVNAMLRSGPLKQQAYADIEVASVDSFQGREKDYIILSCVRSNEHQGIGFLNDPRRLNVALTRARYGIIIIGNSRVLARNPTWYSLLAHFKAIDCLVEGPLLNLVPCQMEFPRPPKVKFGVAVRYDSVARAAAVAQITGSTQPVVDTSVVGYTLPTKNPTVKALRELMPVLSQKPQQQTTSTTTTNTTTTTTTTPGSGTATAATTTTTTGGGGSGNRQRTPSPPLPQQLQQQQGDRKSRYQQQAAMMMVSPFSVSQESSQMSYEDFALGVSGMSLGFSQASMSSQATDH